MTHEPTGAVELSVWSKVGLVALTSSCISGVSLTLRTAEHGDKISFSPIAASFISEVMKVTVAFDAPLGYC